MNHLKVCQLFINTLRAIYLMHQHHHWISKGENFYGNHLLFERIYQSAAEDADLAAEKFVGVFGEEVLEYVPSMELLGKILAKYNDLAADPLAQSIKIEQDCVALCKNVYDILKSMDKLSLGIDDMIMSISSNREEALYLLGQANK